MLVIGVSLLILSLGNRNKTSHRVAALAVTTFLALRYIWWRGAKTLAPLDFTLDALASWTLFLIELVTIASTISVTLLLTRVRDRSVEADANESWWEPNPAPRVAVLIPTYNEDLAVLRRTIIGAAMLEYPNYEVLVLDDGCRDWLRDYCARRSIRYIRRQNNKGSKAGNINHALNLLAEDMVQPDFIAIFDADFVPHRSFLRRTVALMKDVSIGIVQTPQHFFNADPIQHNLNLSKAYPDEQRFFFDHLQASRDAWGIAICCGTSSLARWKALREIGGLPQDSVTEDFLLTLTLQGVGYGTAYLNEPLSEGLAPEGLGEFITQRTRWCLGVMQIVRSPYGPLGTGHRRIRDRWSIIDAFLFWLMSSIFRLAAIFYPLLYWCFGIISVNASVSDVISYFLTYYFWSIAIMQFLSRGALIPILVDVSQLLCATPVVRAIFTGLVRPAGHKFSVTAKGGDRKGVVVQWRPLSFFLSTLLLTFCALLLGSMFDSFADFDAGSGKNVVLFWSIYNMIVLALAAMVCIELPRVERHVMDKPERSIFRLDSGQPHRIWISRLASDNARIRGRRYQVGAPGLLRIPAVGDMVVEVDKLTEDGAYLCLKPTDDQFEALLRKLHTEDGAPGVTALNIDNFLRDFAKRLALSR